MKKNTLWDNDMVSSALSSMSKEDIERYKKIGESMYKNIDYEKSEICQESSFMDDAVAYIVESIKSGLHPSMLTKDEVNVLETVYGKEWYKKWDYVEEDLKEIVTVSKQ
jgi:hypothetical protein